MNDSEWMAIGPYDSPILEPMNDQPKDLMTLDVVKSYLSEVKAGFRLTKTEEQALKSALHHLEAARRALEELAKGEMECGHCTRGGETYDEFAKKHITP